jgi:hypothetical protein
MCSDMIVWCGMRGAGVVSALCGCGCSVGAVWVRWRCGWCGYGGWVWCDVACVVWVGCGCGVGECRCGACCVGVGVGVVCVWCCVVCLSVVLCDVVCVTGCDWM